MPTENELKGKGWNEVPIDVTPEGSITIRGDIRGKILQYSMKHIGVVTIIKSQGEPLPLGIVVEITEIYSQWEKVTL